MSAESEVTTSDLSESGVILRFPPENDCVATITKTTTSPSPTPPKLLPKRLRRRLQEMSAKYSSRSTAEEIDAKLKEADLRRKQYYESLSSKARSLPKNLSCFSPREEDLAQRLEAKLHSAQRKRLSILAKEQMRLAELNKLREEVKCGTELRYEQKCNELGMKLETRLQQAEENRLFFHKTYRQRRAAMKERAAQSLMRRTIQERKYRERVHAAIHHKRRAAEEKRLELLEAKKNRIHTKILQAKHAANIISSQQVSERMKRRDQLEDRLRRAKRQREEILRKRGTTHASSHGNSEMIQDNVNQGGKKLLMCWKTFFLLKRTTLALTKGFEALELNEASVKSMSFEQLATKIESPRTIQTVGALLDRFENYYKISQKDADIENINHLLNHVLSSSRDDKILKISKRIGKEKVGCLESATKNPVKLSRYPVRVVLCAYMILGNSDAVFSGTGERNDALAISAVNFIHQFEMLIKIVLDGPHQASEENATSSVPIRSTFRSQLETFDKSWCSYLCCFVVWKAKDAKLLEGDLVRAACQLETSLMRTLKMAAKGAQSSSAGGMKAFEKQAMEDIKLIEEKVKQLSGIAGLERMESALSDARSRCLESKENEVSSQSTLGAMPGTYLLGASGRLSVSAPGGLNSSTEGHSTSRHATLSPKKCASPPDYKHSPNAPSRITNKGELSFPSLLGSENELLVNEIVHAHRHGITDILPARYGDPQSIQEKIREAMEKAFWDGLLDSIEQENPDFCWILKLMKEVRDELCEMSPSSWNQEIIETLNPDVLSEVLSSGNMDINYLGKILEFALVTLQKLSAPANDDEIATNHHELLKELGVLSQAGGKSSAPFSLSMVKGLRFVLQQIQILKREISEARIKIIEPLIKSPAGFEYLRKAFSNRYGSPSMACTALQLTRQWLESVSLEAEQEWGDYIDSLSALTRNNVISSVGLPATTLQTGGSLSAFSRRENSNFLIAGTEQPGCSGEKIDMLVRLGLAKFANMVVGLTVESLPETLKLNAYRLREVQSKVQKIIVISTSMLILRQTFISENLVSPVDVEAIVTKCTEHLSKLLNTVEDVGVQEIVQKINASLEDYQNKISHEKLQMRKEIMASMLAKSLQAGDPIFTKVSRTIYLALRGVLLGGSGAKGRQVAEMMLCRIASVSLTEKVVEAAEVLIVMATVSSTVHRAWYEELLKNLSLVH